jgi:flagellar hook-associated protein 1 FlgK
MSNSLNSITSNAASGLLASQSAITVLSDNIANAGVAGYTAKQLDVSALVVGGETDGVRTGQISRSVDAALQASVWSTGSRVAALMVRSQALQAVNDTQGTPSGGTSLADAVAGLQSSFTTLQSDPSSQTQQAAVVSAANTLATTINSTASAITDQRNSVQNQIVSSVATLNSALATVQSTTHDIIAATAQGQDTSTLEDTRDAALQTVSSMLNVSYDKQANGNITILGQNGFSIPLDSTFSTASAVLSPASAYAAGSTSVPPILLQTGSPPGAATDVTGLLSGGQLGELVQLRDSTLPAYTASLDAFSSKLANQFSSQGLTLFTDGTGTASPTSYAGLSSVIQVNPTVAATPSLVRDGTPGSAYATNPAGGPAGYTDLINRVLKTSFAGSGATTSLAADAQGFVSQQSSDTAQASTDLSSATAYQTTVSSRFSDQSGVNVDTEMGLMIQLQNSYQANARVIQTAQAMFTALVNAISN